MADQVFSPQFLSLPESGQVQLLNAISQLPCAASVPSGSPTKSSASALSCFLCDSAAPWDKIDLKTKTVAQRAMEDRHFDSSHDQIMEFFALLAPSTDFQKITKSRIHAVLAIRRLLLHKEVSNHLDIKISSVGQFVLKSLNSTIRELRIVAGFTLPVFLRNELPEACRHANRVVALEYLRKLSARDDANILETTILAWGQVGQVCGDEELNLVLLQLVELLGHTNSLICGLAFNELLRLSEAFSCYPEELLKPFSRSISISVVKDLLIRPQKVQQLADLLRIGVNQYLLATGSETLPYLVLAKKRDVLQRLASAHGPETTVQDICMQPRANLIAILSQLLLESASDIEPGVMELLCAVAPGFADYDLANLVKLDSILIMCELLKAAGDANVPRKYQVWI